MKNIIYRIIGLIVLILGAYSLYNVALSISHPVETMNFPIQISKITFAWVAIYGGYQTSSGRKLGHKMSIAWLSYQSMLIAIVALIFLYNFITHENNFNLSFSYQNIIVGFSIFCVPALFFLLKTKLDNNLVVNDTRHTLLVGKLLSVLSPGLGRMIVGNNLLGLILFIGYYILVSGTISSSNSEIQNLVVNSVYKLIVWSIFVKFDWYVVQNYGESAQEELALAPRPNSTQVNGG